MTEYISRFFSITGREGAISPVQRSQLRHFQTAQENSLAEIKPEIPVSKWSQALFFMGLFVGLALLVTMIIVPVYIAPLLMRTSSITTTTSTSTTSTTTTSTTTTTTVTTTTAVSLYIPSNYYSSCAYACTNVTTSTASTLIASWRFDQNLYDDTGYYNAYLSGGGYATYISGYVNQAISFNEAYFAYATSYLSFSYRSFTVEMWLLITQTLSTSYIYAILEQCYSYSTRQCLFMRIQSERLYFGFYGDDLFGNVYLQSNVWTHVAFVYDYSTNLRYIYVNGVLDNSAYTGGPYIGGGGYLYIGYTDSNIANYYFPGSIDKVTVSNRVKIACELLNDATLVSYYPFDGTTTDNGPNTLTSYVPAQGGGGVSYINSRVNQAIFFTQTSSYFQSCSYQALSANNQPYSFALWIYPNVSAGTILHVTSDRLGAGAWCLPMLGFTANGSLIAQSWMNGLVSVWGPQIPQFNWTHVAVTWSSGNGLRLYVNGALYNSVAMPTFSSNTGSSFCILLATSDFGTICNTGALQMGPYIGAIDEFYVYSREITSIEICPLAHH